MTILERIEKTYKKHIGNNAEMSPKRVPAKVSNLAFLVFWGVLNDLYWGPGGFGFFQRPDFGQNFHDRATKSKKMILQGRHFHQLLYVK